VTLVDGSAAQLDVELAAVKAKISKTFKFFGLIDADFGKKEGYG
jgi:hypothetical protein